MTGDHNFWVLRAECLLSSRARTLSHRFLAGARYRYGLHENLDSIDILPYLAETRLSVFAEEPILDYVAASGTDGFVAAMRDAGLNPTNKLQAIHYRVRGRGVKVRHFLNLLGKTERIGWALRNVPDYRRR